MTVRRRGARAAGALVAGVAIGGGIGAAIAFGAVPWWLGVAAAAAVGVAAGVFAFRPGARGGRARARGAAGGARRA